MRQKSLLELICIEFHLALAAGLWTQIFASAMYWWAHGRLACVACGFIESRRRGGEGSGGDFATLLTFSLFLSLSSAKIQYGAQTDLGGQLRKLFLMCSEEVMT